jgi:hypothetical protein
MTSLIQEDRACKLTTETSMSYAEALSWVKAHPEPPLSRFRLSSIQDRDTAPKMQGPATHMGETTTQAEVGAVMSLVNSVVELLEDLPLTENGTGHVPKGTKGRVIRTNGGDLVAVRFPRGNYWCNIKELRILS